jgi:peptide/nickel transport system substrate-binding protein
VFAALLFLGAGLAGPALAQKPADTLRIEWRDAIPNVDPYYNELRTGLVLAHHVWDTLVFSDPETFQIKPQLALSWSSPDPTTIDFTLRPGVTFQNGDPFTADDVVYTINTVIADPHVAVPSNFLYLAGAEKLGPLLVRVKLRQAFPAALSYIATTLPIWPQAYRERVGPAAFSQAPIGTGPYRIDRLLGLTGIDLQRYDGYFAGPKGIPAIAHLAIREVADGDTEVADLKAGRADWIRDVTAAQFDAINATAGLAALRSESMRFAYLSLDAAGRSGAGNPLTRETVREAIAAAIDRRAMVRDLVQGGARVLDAPCYPTQFGCDQAAAVRMAYDPARAKQLLADAGYPKGFATELVTYATPPWGAAVRDYLKAVGIDVTLTQLPLGAAIARAADGSAPLFMGTWGSYSINDVSAVLPFFFGGGDNDYTRDPAVQELVAAAGMTGDTDRRRGFYSKVIRLVTGQVDWLPLFTTVSVYGISRALWFRPYPDDIPRFYMAHWN